MGVEKIKIRVTDGPAGEFDAGANIASVFSVLMPDDQKRFIGARLNGKAVDLAFPVNESAELAGILPESEEGEDILRHTAAHIMAQAVQELFPGTRVAIGPTIEKGFYYDFDTERPFTPEDLEKITKRMREIIKRNLPIVRSQMSREEALAFFAERHEDYKVELINDLTDEPTVSLYTQGDYVDLCRGPHLPRTSLLRHFKLLSVAGAYWRGDEKNAMLQRIYGTAFARKEDLKQYLQMLEEAKKRDHRKLGRQLELFEINETVGGGLILYHPKGAMLRWILEDFEKQEHLKRGYQPVIGPQILKSDTWRISGHYDYYKENMYFTEIEGKEYGIKPMNCPAHMMIFKSKTRSYRDLPIRFFELGTVHRHEKTGVLHGLLRVRGFTQDDAHIFCLPEQLTGEIIGVIDFIKDVMKVFGFAYSLEISTRPEKSIGSDEDWERATKALQDALATHHLSYEINEGDGAFYGPKIDVKIRDAIGRSWQCATIQCDFTLPERFQLTYVGSDGAEHRPVMLHRVILGSLERFMAVLIEHHAGKFPTWLAPTQAVIINITDAQLSYAGKVKEQFDVAGIRTVLDDRKEKMGYKIREAQMQKVPYMIIIGDREVESSRLSLRSRDRGDLGDCSVEETLRMIRSEIEEKRDGSGTTEGGR
ncbi:MAG: threonine--tRNA ligase [Deltaproteobacteria bacterium]|nr:threonine--tRNA ligase [Deltaproteobacteria bacterium]